MTVGSQLQAARRERKISLADVVKETKIQPWILEALETDRLQDIMSPIYVKGFLATYARFLHLPPEPLSAQLPWPKAEPELTPETAAPAAPATGPWLPAAWRGRLGLAAGAVAALAALLILPLRARPPDRAPVGAPRPSARLASVAPVKEIEALPASPTLTMLPTQPLELSVSARRTTWIQVRADGRLLTQQRLPRGAKEQWTAEKRFELILARPSQVEIALNGQPIEPFAIAHGGRLLITHHGVTRLPDDAP